MSLHEFDVLGQGEIDEETEAVIRAPDPLRSLVRYAAGDREVFVAVRLNVPLISAAVALPILLLQPTSAPDDLLPMDGSLTAASSVRSYTLLEQIGAAVVEQGCPAWYLAERHGDGRRDFYFATQDVARLDAIARRVAEASGFPLTVDQLTLAEAAPTILPTELIGELQLELPATAGVRRTRFEFWGDQASLDALRRELERRGYRYLDVDALGSELRMVKDVPIDGPGFLSVLREIAPLARSLRCSYRGTETVGGFDQFRLTRALPSRYAGDGGGGVRSRVRRLFGGSDR